MVCIFIFILFSRVPSLPRYLVLSFANREGGKKKDFSYCGTSLPDKNIIYIQGRNGALANMDIDCDGAQGGPADDGRCGNSDDTQSITSFQWLVEGYGVPGVRDLNPYVHSYVVFGNSGSKPGG